MADSPDRLYHVAHATHLRPRPLVLDLHQLFVLLYTGESKAHEIDAGLANLELCEHIRPIQVTLVAQPHTTGTHDGTAAGHEGLQTARKDHVARVQGHVQLRDEMEMGERLAISLQRVERSIAHAVPVGVETKRVRQ